VFVGKFHIYRSSQPDARNAQISKLENSCVNDAGYSADFATYPSNLEMTESMSIEAQTSLFCYSHTNKKPRLKSLGWHENLFQSHRRGLTSGSLTNPLRRRGLVFSPHRRQAGLRFPKELIKTEETLRSDKNGRLC
jgi:hypothetical protein